MIGWQIRCAIIKFHLIWDLMINGKCREKVAKSRTFKGGGWEWNYFYPKLNEI